MLSLLGSPIHPSFILWSGENGSGAGIIFLLELCIPVLSELPIPVCVYTSKQKKTL